MRHLFPLFAALFTIFFSSVAEASDDEYSFYRTHTNWDSAALSSATGYNHKWWFVNTGVFNTNEFGIQGTGEYSRDLFITGDNLNIYNVDVDGDDHGFACGTRVVIETDPYTNFTAIWVQDLTVSGSRGSIAMTLTTTEGDVYTDSFSIWSPFLGAVALQGGYTIDGMGGHSTVGGVEELELTYTNLFGNAGTICVPLKEVELYSGDSL